MTRQIFVGCWREDTNCLKWTASKTNIEFLQVKSIENKFTRMRARFTFGKKLCPLFLQIFQLLLCQKNAKSPWCTDSMPWW